MPSLNKCKLNFVANSIESIRMFTHLLVFCRHKSVEKDEGLFESVKIEFMKFFVTIKQALARLRCKFLWRITFKLKDDIESQTPIVRTSHCISMQESRYNNDAGTISRWVGDHDGAYGVSMARTGWNEWGATRVEWRVWRPSLLYP